MSFRISLLIASLCILCLALSCRNEHTSIAACNASKKIPVLKEFVYDLSGYEGNGGASPFSLFDENDWLDPKNGAADAAITNPQPIVHSSIYFARGIGNRIMVDLRTSYNIGEIYVYDRSSESDSVWIYTGIPGDMKLRTGFVTKGDPSFWGWRKFQINDTSQFVMIRFSSPQAQLNEMVMYGCPANKLPTEPPQTKYTGQRLPVKTLKDFLGVNMYIDIPMKWLAPFSSVRMYTIANTFDMDTVNAYPNNNISISRYGYLYKQDSFRHFSDDMAQAGKTLWYSVRGVPVWMNKRNMWDKDRPVTKIKMDTEDPLSYGRHANMMWTLAAVFGKTSVDTNQLRIADMIRVSGKGTMTLYENGNEEDAWWAGDLYCSPLEYFAQSSADYDGHEGRLGPRHGIHVADTNSKLMMSGMIEFDTARLKVLDFLSRHLRSDKKFIWEGGIQFHHYSTRLKNSTIFNRNKTTVAISPEEDSLRVKLSQVRDFAYRINPNVECILGEYGYDKSQASPMGVPLVPGFTASQSQGIMLLRGINAVAFSGFDRLMIYWMKDDVPENDPNIYLTSGVVRQMQDGSIVPYPGWFYLSTLINTLGDYVPEKIISEKNEGYAYQYRSRSHPDSLAYIIYSPTRSGKKIKFSLTMPSSAKSVEVVDFADNSTTGIKSQLPVHNGLLTLEIKEIPRIVLVNTPGMAN